VIRVNWATFGCKANQADTDALSDEVSARLGDEVEFVSDYESADVVVMNTCTVTHQADTDARKAIRRVKRRSPGAKIVVTGCYAQVAEKRLATWPEIDHLVGNVHKATIPSLIQRINSPTSDEVVPQTSDWDPSMRSPDAIRGLPATRTRPFLKVQDGCNYVCSFCIIPEARGASRSLALSEVLASAQRLEEAGAHEIVLTGIHLAHWGRDLTPKQTFVDLLHALIGATERVRFRISSIEPNEVTDEFLSLVAEEERICDHLHVPLQSGDDAVLKRMRRVYRVDWYRRIFEAFRSQCPDGAWGIDVMTGFPGETDEEFQNTYRFLRSLDFTYLHVFPYSAREGTVAAELPDPVDPRVRKVRTQRLLALSKSHQKAHYERAVGKHHPVVVENRRVNDQLRGLTGNYVPVLFDGSSQLMETLTSVCVRRVDEQVVYGETL